MSTSAHCPVCAAPAAVLYPDCRDFEYFMTADYQFYRCSTCALAFLHPMPTREDLPGLYPATYHNFDPPANPLTSFLFERYYQHQCDTCLRYVSRDGAFLEIGSGGGGLLARLRDRGVQHVQGVELSEDGWRRSREKGLDVFHGTLEEFETDRRFDMVFMSHVIEHVVDPVDTLRIACNLLKEGGTLYIETPNVGSLDARLWGDMWGLIHYPRHLYLFDRTTIADVVQRAGFTVVRQTWELNSCGWALSFQSAMRKAGVDHSQLPRSAYYPFLLLAFLPFNLVDLCLGGTAFMSLIGRKENGAS